MARQELGVFDDPLALGLEAPEEPETPEEGQVTDAAAAQQALSAEEGPATEPAQAPTEGEPTEEPEEGGQPQQTEETDRQGALILGKFKSPEDVARAYQELERKLGARDEEKEQLRQQVAFLSNQLAQAFQVVQMLQTQNSVQGAIPVPGYVGQGRGAVASAPATQIDPEQFRDALYSGNPVEAIAGLVQPMIEQAVQRYGQQISAGLQQMMTPVQQYVDQQRTVQSFQSQLQEITQKYADQPEGYRVDDLKDEMSKVFDEHPHIAKLPNAMEAAYWEARTRKMAGNVSQQVAQATQQASATQKAAARLTTSTGGPVVPQQKSPEDQIREATFGAPGQNKGIFDD